MKGQDPRNESRAPAIVDDGKKSPKKQKRARRKIFAADSSKNSPIPAMVARVGIPAVNTCQTHGDGSFGT